MSTILKSALRPVVQFDANNPQHRQHFHEFLKTRTWAKCPVQFALEDMYTDVVSMISDKMLARSMGIEAAEMA